MGLPPTQENVSITPPLVTAHFLKDLQRQQTIRILIADDHQVNQQLAVLMIERLGFSHRCRRQRLGVWKRSRISL